MKSQYTTVNGLRTHYIDSGEGDAIVLVHGGESPGTVSCLYTWHRNIPALSKHYRVIAVDRVGHGYTDNPDESSGYHVSAVADHILALLRQLGVSRATVVGTSRGALHATYLAMVAPEIVERLVVTNSASLAPRHSSAYVNPGEKTGYFLGGPENARHDLEGLNYDPTTIDDSLVELVAEMLASPQRVQARANTQFQRGTSEHDAFLADLQEQKDRLLAWLSDPGVPGMQVGIVWGALDKGPSVQDGLELFELFSKTAESVRMLLLDRCGHRPFMERSEEFNSWLLSLMALPRHGTSLDTQPH